MKASKDCIALIKHYEGYKTKPYLCPAHLYTVGYGHVIGNGHTLPGSWNRTFTVDEINALLVADLARFERGITNLTTLPLKQCEFDALVSFAFNLGVGCYQRSTVRQKINRGNKEAAMQTLLKYNKAGGKILRGLTLRRKDEVRLFNK